MRRTVVIALVAVMVALAGCGATTQGSFPSDSTAESDAALQPTSGSVDESAGTIAFYVSDEPAAIEDFEHLNVTIEKIGLQKKGAEDADDDMDEADAEGEDAEADEDEVKDDGQDAEESDDADDQAENETDEEDESEAGDLDEDDGVNATDANESGPPKENADQQEENEDAEADDEAEDESDDAENESEEADDKDESEGWVTYEVDNRTVDLTELKGENATRLANLTAPNGTYTAVFVYVSDVEGVLKGGEEVNVKLPSQKLQLHTTFEVGQNANTDFVYDIAVHKAGNSGKYILKPNIAESGTDVKIRDIDTDDEDEEREDESEEADDENEEENEEEDEEESEDVEETELSIAPEGNVSPGETVIFLVTDENESAVGGLNLSVEFGDGYNETIAQTDADGQVEIPIPEDAEELVIEVAEVETDEEAEFEGEFEHEFEDD